jgi:hypothetical protein
MQGGARKARIDGWAIWLACLFAISPGTARAVEIAVPFGAADRAAYAAWLPMLAADAAQLQADGAEFDLGAALMTQQEEPSPVGGGQGPKRAAASAQLLQFERRQRLPGAGRELSAAEALGAARNCRRLGEYASALLWYGRASELDATGALSGELQPEILACAAAAGDSLAFVQALLNTLGTSDLTGRDDELVTALRHLLAAGDQERLALLTAKIAGQVDRLGERVRFWLAFAAAQQRQWDSALERLRALLLRGDPQRALRPEQRLWIAVAVPDLLFLLGQGAAAADLYRLLEASPARPAAAWSSYQLANLDLLAGRYASARRRYADVCPASDSSPWRARACVLAALADTLDILAKEGGRDGADHVAVP